MTPGTWLKLRREAAGLTVEDVAAAVQIEAREIELAEADKLAAEGRLLGGLAALAGLRTEIYSMLRNGEPVQLCRQCGCSHWDPCEDEVDSACSWAEPDLCTACERKAA